MVFARRALIACLPVAACQGSGASKPPPPPPPQAIEVRDATRSVIARVQPGRPCRATIDGIELLVGTRPLVAQLGADRWEGDDAANGTTLRKNGERVARIHAGQLFDADGIPVIRVLENGEIVDKTNAVVRTATRSSDAVAIGDLAISGTTDIVLAAMLTAREADPAVRALAACHFLLNE